MNHSKIFGSALFALLAMSQVAHSSPPPVKPEIVVNCSGMKDWGGVWIKCTNTHTQQHFKCWAQRVFATTFTPICHNGLRSSEAGLVTDDGVSVGCNTFVAFLDAEMKCYAKTRE